MAAPYICFYINIHCTSHSTITSLGNQPNMKLVANIPWKLVSLCLGMERQILKNLWGAKTFHWNNQTLADSLLLLIKVFISFPPSHLLLHLHEASCRRWREKYFCQNQLLLSLKMSLTQGCILGTYGRMQYPEDFSPYSLYFLGWRNWVTQLKEQQVFVMKVLQLGWIISHFCEKH